MLADVSAGGSSDQYSRDFSGDHFPNCDLQLKFEMQKVPLKFLLILPENLC